ncbi:MAG: glycosyltransferase [Waltera sp.]
MAKLNIANLKKTLYYLQRNGLRETWISVRERLTETDRYFYVPCPEEELERQSCRKWDNPVTLSIVVPLYRTPGNLSEQNDNKRYATELSSLGTDSGGCHRGSQCGGDVDKSGIPDRTAPGKCETIAADARIHYIHLTENAGIAANTNQALPYARGEYIGLLDHDDVLTPDALYEMADAITKANDRGVRVAFAYSDEDKCNGDETKYYDPNHKEDFNYDLILSNNYICHFLVMDADLMKKLAFRPECDGAQDYDLVLRAVSEVLAADGRSGEERILHIPRVLYHWRCHEASTAANPHSKKYAYEAGLRALQDYAAERGIPAKAEETRHVGFYRLQYTEVLQERPDVAAVGGRVLSGKNRGRIAGGRMTADGKVFYEGLPKDFGGYLHRRSCPRMQKR